MEGGEVVSDTTDNIEEMLTRSCEDFERDAASRRAFFTRVRAMDDAEFVEAVRDFHVWTESWMGSVADAQNLDRELRCRELLKKGNV